MKLTVKIKANKFTYLAVVCLFFALLALLLVNVNAWQSREKIVEWRPASRPGDNASHSPSGGTAANAAARLSRSGGLVVLGGSGGSRKDDPQYSYYSRGWNQSGQWWQLSDISTQGYEQIELSFATRGSNTGPKFFKIEYSTDGDNWLPLADSENSWIVYSTDADNRYHPQGPFSLSAAVSDLPVLHIRFFNDNTESVIGNTTKSSGTSYITDISITGISG